jgi:hypothetical protein
MRRCVVQSEIDVSTNGWLSNQQAIVVSVMFSRAGCNCRVKNCQSVTDRYDARQAIVMARRCPARYADASHAMLASVVRRLVRHGEGVSRRTATVEAVSSTLLAGRCARVGYSAVVIAVTLGNVVNIPAA